MAKRQTRYKPGDRVVVRRDLELGSYNGLGVVSGMLLYKGKPLTVMDVTNDGKYFRCQEAYVCRPDGSVGYRYKWDDEMVTRVPVIRRYHTDTPESYAEKSDSFLDLILK